MKQIIVEDLVKTYRISKRRQGIFGAAVGLFHRDYQTIRALDGIDFILDQGELVGYIGPNGAGKSTTVKVMSGILVPDSGRCEVLGRTPWKERIANVREIGVVFGQRTQLWWDLPVIESFELLRDIYKVEQTAYAEKRDELVEMLQLEPLLNIPVRQLSLGQRMRCDLTASLLHSPTILFLDEPTIGLDAVVKLAVRDFVSRLNRERGVTVILTTHDMDDIESLCKRVMVIGKGKILFDGNLEKLREDTGGERRLIIDLDNSGADFSDSDARVIRQEGNRLHLAFDPERIPAKNLISRITAKYQVVDLYVEGRPIEEVIAQLYQDLEI
ncbi:MAG: ATP-binding cassette domain-containing protein [Proteobacteria bacterium]|nr:ATP-binding cassette domain-containing protein [Pseudomonadota bacterium]